MTDNNLQLLLHTESDKISYQIEKQFPSIYRENGQELIELIQSYYRFLETQQNQSVFNARKMYEYRNIDTTLENMILFFKNKFLSGLFLTTDIRFIVKNILDLYRRKGSKEGIELFFKLFFDAEIQLYYPSEDIFKPSQSKWTVGNYIQLHPVETNSGFETITNKKIYGNKSKAEGIVDTVYFVEVGAVTIPVLFLSQVKGKFIASDEIYTLEPTIFYGTIYGSIDKANLDEDQSAFTAENRIGDFVSIKSSISGFNAKGRISKVSENLAGNIMFDIENGGYGYTVSSNTSISENLVLISDQTLFIDNISSNLFVAEETIQQTNSFGVLVVGIIIGQNRESIGVLIDKSVVGYDPETHFFEADYTIETVDRENNISRNVIFASTVNDTANFEVGSISNTEIITIIPDRIEDFIDVTLDELNYSTANTATAEMSGTVINGTIVSITTPLNEAFVPIDLEIGTISSLSSIDPGVNYLNDSFVLVKESFISTFGLKNQILQILPAGVAISVNDILLQEKDTVDFLGNNVTKLVKGKVTKVLGNQLTVQQLTFETFTADFDIYKETAEDILIPVSSVSTDFTTLPMGLNANISAKAEFSVGKIQEIQIIDSGIGYINGENVTYFNQDKNNRIQTELNSFETLQAEFEDLVDIFGYLDPKEKAVKRWNLPSIYEAISANIPRNLIQNALTSQDSENFSTWGGNATRFLVPGKGQFATGWRLLDNSTTVNQQISNNVTPILTETAEYLYQIFCSYDFLTPPTNGRSLISMQGVGASVSANIFWDVNGAISSVTSASGFTNAVGYESLGDGLYSVWARGNIPANLPSTAFIWPSAFVAGGTAQGGIIVYGSQIERNATIPTPYQKVNPSINITTKEPEFTLFVNTFISNNSVGDTNQDGSYTIQDMSLFNDYITNIDNINWRNTNSDTVDYIETVMLPYMEENYGDYVDYGTFTEQEYLVNQAKIDFLLSKDIEENILLLEEELENISELGDATGTIHTNSQGITEGKWTSFDSHINQEKKIQDSYYFQDYSYEIITDILPSEFEDTFRELIHPSGIKFFSSYSKTNKINTSNRFLSSIEIEE